MNKRLSIRLLACLAVLISVMGLAANGALAVHEQENSHVVTMNFSLNSNLILARYSVNVYLDDEELGVIPQGGMLLKIRNVAEGVHTIKITADKKGVPDMSFDIYVGCETTITAGLQTHRKYVGVESLTVNIADKEIAFAEGSSVSWKDFMQEIVVLTMMDYM